MKKLLLTSILASSLLATTACKKGWDISASQRLILPVDKYSEMVEVNRPNTKTVIVKSLELFNETSDGETAALVLDALSGTKSGMSADVIKYYLKSVKRKNSVKHNLFVHATYNGDKRNYSSAMDEDSKKLNFELISSDNLECTVMFTNQTCTVNENISVELSDVYLKSKSANGVEVEISDKYGDSIYLNLPADYIKAHLSKLSAEGK